HRPDCDKNNKDELPKVVAIHGGNGAQDSDDASAERSMISATDDLVISILESSERITTDFSLTVITMPITPPLVSTLSPRLMALSISACCLARFCWGRIRMK